MSLSNDEVVIPNFALCRMPKTGEVVAIEAHQSRFFRTLSGVQSQEYVDLLNLGIGVHPSQAQAMNICALTGNWNNYPKIVEDMENPPRNIG